MKLEESTQDPCLPLITAAQVWWWGGFLKLLSDSEIAYKALQYSMKGCSWLHEVISGKSYRLESAKG